MMAASDGDIAEITKLLEKGVDVNAKDFQGETALMVAALKGHLDIAKLLVENGADIHARPDFNNNQGQTALMMASKNGYIDIVKMLVEKGSDVNSIVKHTGYSALIMASEKGKKDVVSLLIEKGADINAKTKEGSTPLMMASLNGHIEIIKFLKEHGAIQTSADICMPIWNDAKQKETKDSYQLYIDKCPDGENISQALEKTEYYNTLASDMHWSYEKFIKKYPKSSAVAEIKKRINKFKTFKAKKDMIITFQTLKKTYSWNESYKAAPTDKGLMLFGEGGEKVLFGSWHIGNLEFTGGSVTVKKDGLKLAEGTELIYRITKK